MKTTHMCLSISGALNWNKRDFAMLFKGAFTADDGHVLSVDEARGYLLDELAKGRKVLPMGECEGFDYQTGCPGHEQDGGAL